MIQDNLIENNQGQEPEVSHPIADPVEDFLKNKGKNEDNGKKIVNYSSEINDLPVENKSTIEKNTDSNELEILKGRLQENQSYARSIKQSVSFMTKSIDESIDKINDLVENGDLSEAQSKEILSILKSKKPAGNIKEPKGLGDKVDNNKSDHPFQKFYDIANEDILGEYKRYTRDKSCDEKVRAFDFYMNEASTEELETLHKELSEIENDPVELLTKMLEVGQQFMDEGYSDFNKSGGIRKYLKEKNSEIETLQKKIDKLDKELSKYKMYDSPTNSIRESSQDKSPASQILDPFDKLVALRRTRG